MARADQIKTHRLSYQKMRTSTTLELDRLYLKAFNAIKLSVNRHQRTTTKRQHLVFLQMPETFTHFYSDNSNTAPKYG